MRSHRRAMGGLIGALLVAGIARGAIAQSASPGFTAVGPADTAWRLATLVGAPVPSGLDADIVFTEIRAGGSAGCDRFSAPYVTDFTSSLVFGPISTTMTRCEDATDTFGQAYLGALGKVAAYAIGSDGVLTMSDADGIATLTYRPTTSTSIVGPWIVRMVSDGRGGVQAAPGMLGPTLTFDPNGSVGGFDGCNIFSGGFGVQGGAITIGPLMSRMMSCGEVKDDEARRYMTALQAATTWSISSGTLDLRDAGGALQVEATSAISH